MLHKPEWDKAGHHHDTVVEARACEAGEYDAYDEGPVCWVCDGLHTGPCPLESMGWEAARWDEEREAAEAGSAAVFGLLR